MRGLTITQPWATLIARGAKIIETRSWRTPYRGPVLIHAAKAFPFEARAICAAEPFASVLEALDVVPAELPTASVVGVASLVDVRPVAMLGPEHIVKPHELGFGDFSPGRYGWVFADDVDELASPVECRGALGLWMATDTLIGRVRSAAAQVAG